MESIKVTPENLMAKADQVDNQANEYYTEYTNLLHDAQTLTEVDWRGEDANKFREKVGCFEEDFKKMKNLMNEYAKFLRDAAKNYQNTQQNVISSINSLR